MSIYIPSALSLPTKYNVFNLHYQRVQALIIDKHTNKIQQICNRKKSPIFEQLSTETFWTNLKAKSKKTKQLDELYNTWLKLKPLAHLDSKQLINLYQDHVVSLERCYQYLIAQFPEENIKEQLKDNVKRLSSLKQHIFEGLRYRAQIHKELKSPRNVDDLLALLCTKLNNLNLLDVPFEIPSTLSATLNDDRRLFAFDLLKMNNVDEDTLHNEVLSSVPKRGHTPLKTKAEVKEELDNFNKYRNNALKSLGLKGTGEYLYAMSYSSKLKGIKNVFSEFYKKSKDFIKEWVNLSIYDQLVQLRFVLYTAICFGAYYYLVQILQPVALLFLSTSTFALVSSALFYTVAMAPVWWLGYQVLKTGFSFVHDYLACWKKREILDSLIVLEDTEHLICERFSQIVVDIPHFDIKELNARVSEVESALNDAKTRLNRFAPGERFICGGQIRKQAKNASDKIDSLKSEIKNRLNQLASHIALRVGEDIEVLDMSFDSNSLEPILPKKQLERLRDFVHKIGDTKVKSLFDKNANIVNKWREKITSDRFCHEDAHAKGSYHQPWGGSKVRNDCLKGWQVILTSFTTDLIQRNALLQLNDLIAGKTTLTSDQLQETIQHLGASERGDKPVLDLIQGFIFKTLQTRSPQYASLLSDKQKASISRWHSQHKNEISEAKLQVNRIFSSGKLTVSQLNKLLGEINNKKLCQYFELLDAEDIYSCSTGKLKSLKDRHNHVRKFFEEYDGSTSHAYRLINFVPKHEQAATVTEFASKRLSWFLENVKNGVNLNAPFDEYDTALFNNADLHKLAKFDFTQFVLNSRHFKGPWSQEMESFLSASQDNGLDSGSLLSKYLEKKETFNALLINQKGKSKSSSSRVEEKKASSQFENTRRRRARV